MIPRLWQCERPEWWEHLLGAPFSSYAVFVLLGVYIYLRARQRRSAALLVRRLWLALIMANVTIVASGLFIGLVVRVMGGSPNSVYEGARAAWLGFGWATMVGVAAWHFKSPVTVPPVESPFSVPKRINLAFLAIFVMLIAPLVGFFRYTHSPTIQMARAILEFFPDIFSPAFQTDECLYEHELEYLAPQGGDYGPPGSLAANNAGDELGSRLRSRNLRIDIEPANRAFRSYRQKVLRGELREPKAFDGLNFRNHPRQLAELRAWAEDPRHSDESRALARRTLEEILHPPVRPEFSFGLKQKHD